MTAYSVGRDTVLPLLSILTPLALIGILLGVLLRARVSRWRTALSARFLHVDARPFLRAIAFVALFMLFLWHSDIYLDKFERPLCYANLLYTDGGTAKCGVAGGPAAEGLRAALLGSDKALLDAAFQDLTIGLAGAMLIAWLTWRVTLPWRWHAWCVAPSFFATALYVLLLPMDYGVLQRAINYPRIALTFDAKSAFPVAGPVFLLNKSSSDFVVWGAASRKLIWVPAGSVKRAEVDGAYDLFDARWRKAKTTGEKK